MISLRTNTDSLNAQMNLKMNSNFQSKTIQQLTSGYRINQSGDDAAGLAIANTFRSNINELQQGVANANDGLGQLQIVDGGLNNISTLLDRMKTLATQSASGTFTGSRVTLNQEYSQLIKEISRQASNIQLNAGGALNANLSVYIGGATNSGNANIGIDLSGPTGAVDATSLRLDTTNVLSGGVSFGANGNRLDAPGATFVVGSSTADDESFTFNLIANGAAISKTVKIAATSGGSTLDQVLNSFNGQLANYGISASVDGNGKLQFTGATAFTVSQTDGTASTNDLVTASSALVNTSNYTAGGAAFAATPAAQTLTFQNGSGSASVSLLAADSVDAALAKINAQTAQLGIYAVKTTAGTGISFQSSSSFSANASAVGVFTATGSQTVSGPTTGTSTYSNATAAITAINNAVQALGLVQGRVGAGENKLQYAVNLAQSQISSFSAAESQIRDADVAAQAANLSKSQVLQQTSIAAMAQANQIPQSVLKLLQ